MGNARDPWRYQRMESDHIWQNVSEGGCGVRRFQVLNQRYPTFFVYFSNIQSNGVSNSYTSSKVIAVSKAIAITPNEPTQGHLSFTNITG